MSSEIIQTSVPEEIPSGIFEGFLRSSVMQIWRGTVLWDKIMYLMVSNCLSVHESNHRIQMMSDYKWLRPRAGIYWSYWSAAAQMMAKQCHRSYWGRGEGSLGTKRSDPDCRYNPGPKKKRKKLFTFTFLNLLRMFKHDGWEENKHQGHQSKQTSTKNLCSNVRFWEVGLN